jgi:hypothetical protein
MNEIVHNQEEHFIKIESDNGKSKNEMRYSHKMVNQLNNCIVRLSQEMEIKIIKVILNISRSFDETKDIWPKHGEKVSGKIEDKRTTRVTLKITLILRRK